MSKIIVDGKVMTLPSSGGEIYSEEETRIGTWIDGKPLYRKVVQGTTGEVGVITDIPISNDFHIIEMHATLFINDQSMSFLPYVYIFPDDNTTAVALSWFSYGQLHIKVSAANQSKKPFIAILKYTKTTDQSTLDLQPNSQIDVLLPNITSEASFAKEVNV